MCYAFMYQTYIRLSTYYFNYARIKHVPSARLTTGKLHRQFHIGSLHE